MTTIPGKSPIIRNLIPGLTEIGKIKIGRKGAAQQGGWKLPEKLDHFLITTLERGKDENFLPDEGVHQQLGQEPKRIPVRLLFDDIALNFQCRYSCYFGKTLYCSGDGEAAHQLIGQNSTERKQIQCPCNRQDPHFNGDKNDGKGKCKINGTLSCLIEGAPSVGGVYKFRTTGYNSTVGIYSSLMLIKSLTGGLLAGIPLEMTIQPKVVTSPIDGRSQTVYVVGIQYSGDVKSLQDKTLQLAQQNAAFRERLGRVEEEARRMISVDAELVDQASDIVEEFHPEEMQGGPGPATPTTEQAGTGTGTAAPEPARRTRRRQAVTQEPAPDPAPVTSPMPSAAPAGKVELF